MLSHHFNKLHGLFAKATVDRLVHYRCHAYSTTFKLFMLTVCIEGNIGSGKTSFLSHFKKYESFIQVNDEPVEQWRDFGGHNPLAVLYKDPKRWSFTFQSLVLLTLLKRHQELQTKPVRVMERSIFSARLCFLENLRERDLLSMPEYAILCQWFDFTLQHYNTNVDLILYLRTQPETCYRRIVQRCRPEEQNITMDYITDLHNLHENWLMNDACSAYRPPVMVLNGDDSLDAMSHKVSEVKTQFFKNLERQPG